MVEGAEVDCNGVLLGQAFGMVLVPEVGGEVSISIGFSGNTHTHGRLFNSVTAPC